MAEFPAGVYSPRTKENAVGEVYEPEKTTLTFVEDITQLDDEVVAIENELGASPKGSSSSVAERIKGVKSESDATADFLRIKGERVGVGIGSPNSKLQVAGAISTPIATKTANWSILESDSTILADGTSNLVTITLPTAVGITGRQYIIKCIDDTFAVDVATNGSEEIDGDSENFELIKHEVIKVQSDGANWWII